MTNENKNKILELLSETIEKDISEIKNLDRSTPLTEIGFNSLQFVQFVVSMEEEFNIEVNDSDLLIQKFETIDAIFITMEKYFNPSTSLKKVLILDCDNVLWKGISGEEPVYVDENILRFQQELIRLYENGVLLCLCSRNDIHNIKEAFNSLDMLLSWEHIVCAKINTNDKASNIKKIAEELNLSLDSFLFVDDSDYELGLVSSLLPEVNTVKVDYSDMRFIGIINSFFENPAVPDTNRTKLYKEQKEREKEKLRFNTVDEYNKSLETKYTCRQADEEQAERIAELSQRTNQFNLSCKRYTADEVKQMLNDKNYSVLILSVIDKYGDMGTVGAATVKMTDATAVIENFMLSCRVFGRGFELALLESIKELSKDRDLYGVYVPTEKNKRYIGFYQENGVLMYE